MTTAATAGEQLKNGRRRSERRKERENWRARARPGEA